MHKLSFKSGLVLCAATSSLFNAAHGDAEEPIQQLEDFVVSAGPMARPISDFAMPVTALDSEELRRSSGSTLGALLDGQPGVSATSFGGGASRPIIRGFDGPRVRILESGLGAQDVSETSPDHAVPVEPAFTERVEVLRGPATLLYGSSAIGGVVNVVGREMPRSQSDKTVEGRAEGRYDTVSWGETYLGSFQFNAEALSISIQGLDRYADDYKIPSHYEAEPDEAQESNRLESSFVENQFGSIGASWFWGPRSYLGASVSHYESFYGIPGHEHDHGHGGGGGGGVPHADEEGVAIDLERTRVDTELALFEPTKGIEALRIRFGFTDYKHQEIEEDEAAATFLRESWELRAEASHAGWGVFDEGIFGLQISQSDFEAFGEEVVFGTNFAFGPPSTTRSQAIFISEHIHQGNFHYELGGRIENQGIDAQGAKDYSDLASSLALGFIYELTETNSIALSLQRTERHPNSTELYARGPHLATSQYEIGDPDLGLETAYGADLSLRHESERWSAHATVFYTRFDDFIFSENLGFETDPEGRVDGDAGFEDDEALDTFAYRGVAATFYGLETELTYQAFGNERSELSFSFLADYVRAENEDDDENLPRIPPLRMGVKAEFDYKSWASEMLVRHSFYQNVTAPSETDTDGFTELAVSVEYTHPLPDANQAVLFARAENLLDEEIRHHTSFIKDESPRPGRNFTLGARLEF